MRIRAAAPFLCLTALLLSSQSGCSSSTGSSAAISIPPYTIISGSVEENADGSVWVHPDSLGGTLLFDAALADSAARMTVSGRFEGTHLTMSLFCDETSYSGQDAFMMRAPDDTLFVNLYHNNQGSLDNFDLPGPFMVGDNFTVRLEVDSRAATRRVRYWGPGKDFDDTPDFDSDPDVLAAYGGMRAALRLIGATIFNVGFTAVP